METQKVLAAIDVGNSVSVIRIKAGDTVKFVEFTDESTRHPSNILVDEDADGRLQLTFYRNEMTPDRILKAGVINCIKMIVGLTRKHDIAKEVHDMLVRVRLEEEDGTLVFRYADKTISAREVLLKYMSHLLDMINENVRLDDSVSTSWVFGIAIPLDCSNPTMDAYRDVLQELRPGCEVVFVKEMFAAHFSASDKVNDALEPNTEHLALGIDIGNATAHVAVFSHKKDANGYVDVAPVCTRNSYKCSGVAQTQALAQFLSKNNNFQDAPYNKLFEDTYYVQKYKETIMQAVRDAMSAGKQLLDSSLITWGHARNLPPVQKQLVNKSFLTIKYGDLDKCFAEPVKALQKMLQDIKEDMASKMNKETVRDMQVVLTGGGILGYKVRKVCEAAFPQAAKTMNDATTSVALGVMKYLEYLQQKGSEMQTRYNIEIATQNVALKMEHARQKDLMIVVPLVKKDTSLPIVDRDVHGWIFKVGDLPTVQVGSEERLLLEQEVIEGIFDVPDSGPPLEFDSLPQGQFKVYPVKMYLPTDIKVAFTLAFSLDSQKIKLTHKSQKKMKRGISETVVTTAEADRDQDSTSAGDSNQASTSAAATNKKKC